MLPPITADTGANVSSLLPPRYRSALLAAACITATFGCSDGTPEILQGVSAGGGLWGACPGMPFAQNHPSAISPELNARLASRFPPGTPEKVLVNALLRMGFKTAGSCKDDGTIHILRFDEQGSGFVKTKADVYWQASAEGKILWTKGFVRYVSF